MWIFLVVLYGVIKGVRDIIKKKSLQISSPIEVLFFYTLLSFLIILPGAKTAAAIDMHYMGYIVIKSFIIFVGWICGYKAMSKMPVSLYGVMDMSRVIFASLLGVAVLDESFTAAKTVGMLLVLAGLLLVNAKRGAAAKTSADAKIIVLMLVCCLCNACSEILDKFLMPKMDSTQLQFWYMLYLVLFYLAYIVITRTKVSIKCLKKNYWIWISAILFVIGDKALFIACAEQNSTVIAMTLIKQCSVMITIWGGKLVFGEKNVLYRTLCAGIIIAGIVVALL